MKRIRSFLFLTGVSLAAAAIAQTPPSMDSLKQLTEDEGAIANGTYSNECLGFRFPIPKGWEVNSELLGTPPGKARRERGGGLILLALDQHTGRPLRNRIVLSALDATGYVMDTERFIFKMVHHSLGREGTEIIREVFPTEFAGRQFFRSDYKETGPEGTAYKIQVATPFRSYFLGWTLVSPSQSDLAHMMQTLGQIKFGEDQRDARCIVGAQVTPGGVPAGGVIGGIIRLKPSVPPDNATDPLRVRVSSKVSTALLVAKVQPLYPAEARSRHVQGQVVLTAVVDTDGDVERLTVLSGDPMLVSAAIEAVRQWKYKPYLLAGQAVKMETQVVVSFELEPI